MSGTLGNPGLNFEMGYLGLPAHAAAGLITAAGVSTGVVSTGATHNALATSNNGQTGIQMTTGELVVFRVDCNAWGSGLGMADPTRDLLLEVLWECNKSGGATGQVWKAFAKFVDEGAAMGDPTSSPDSSITFDTAAPSQTVLTSTGRKPMQVPNTMKLASPTFFRRHKRFLNIAIELDAAGTASATETILIGIGINYTVGFLNGVARRET